MNRSGEAQPRMPTKNTTKYTFDILPVNLKNFNPLTDGNMLPNRRKNGHHLSNHHIRTHNNPNT